MGRNLQDFGPFFVENLVAVGCRVMAIGRRSGTLLGTPHRRSAPHRAQRTALAASRCRLLALPDVFEHF
jgi:hypothetical protein